MGTFEPATPRPSNSQTLKPLSGACAYVDVLRRRAAGGVPASPRRVLEAGFGTGLFMARLRTPPGCLRVGIDRRVWRKGTAASSGVGALHPGGDPDPGPVSFLMADVAALPFRVGAFDAVFCVNTLQVLDGRRARWGLSEMVRVAAPGAPVVVTVPNRAHPMLRLRMWLRAASYHGGGAVHAWRPADVLRRLGAAGAAPAGVEAVILPPFGHAPWRPLAVMYRFAAGLFHRWTLRRPWWAPNVVVTAVKRGVRD